MTDEDDEFDRILRENRLKGQPYHWESDAIKAALEAKDEPEYYGLTKDHLWMSISKEHYDRLKPEFRMTCYTTPPQRTWVGLTDEERGECINANTATGLWHMAKDIEAKLKEKNT